LITQVFTALALLAIATPAIAQDQKQAERFDTFDQLAAQKLAPDTCNTASLQKLSQEHLARYSAANPDAKDIRRDWQITEARADGSACTVSIQLPMQQQ
jgi:hypothetical protein